MDSTTLQQAGASTGLIAILLIVYRVLVWLNHRSISSRCCGRTADIQIDITGLSGTPVENKTADNSKDVVSGTNIQHVSTGQAGDSNQTNGQGTEPRPKRPSIVQNPGSIREQIPSPGVLNAGGTQGNDEANRPTVVVVPEHL